MKRQGFSLFSLLVLLAFIAFILGVFFFSVRSMGRNADKTFKVAPPVKVDEFKQPKFDDVKDKR